MGRLEKIVVLTVLFLVAIILAVSVTGETGVAPPGRADGFGAPGTGTTRARWAPELAQAPSATPRPVPSGPSSPAGLLSSVVEPRQDPAPVPEEPVHAPRGRSVGARWSPSRRRTSPSCGPPPA